MTASEFPPSLKLCQAARRLTLQTQETLRSRTETLVLVLIEPSVLIDWEVPLLPTLTLIPSDPFRSFSPYHLACSLAMFDPVTLLLNKALQRLSLLFIMKSLNCHVVSRTLQDLDPAASPTSPPPSTSWAGSQLCSFPDVPLSRSSQGMHLAPLQAPLPVLLAPVSFSKYLNIFIYFLKKISA